MRTLTFIALACVLYYSSNAQLPARPAPVVPIRLSSAYLHEQAARILVQPSRCHSSVSVSNLRMRLRNVVIDSSILWFHLRLYNTTRINFQPAFCRFTIRSRSGTKRKAIQSVEVIPFRRPILGPVRYRHRYDLLVPFVPFALVKPQRLVIEVGEARSGRLLKLSIPAKAILQASYLP